MKLLVCYDGSEQAKKALQIAKEHAGAFDAKIEVASAIDRYLPLEFKDIQSAKQNLQHEIWQLLGKDDTLFNIHLLIDSCSPGEQLVNFAERENVDEIIIGVRRKSKAGKLLFGSTAQYVVLNAPCPVLTVK